MRSPARFSFWWLLPAWAFGLMSGITLLLAYWQNKVEFELYGMLKYVEPRHVMVGAITIFTFSAGCYFGQATESAAARPVNLRILQRWFTVCAGLTIFGYLAWLGVGLRNGASPAMFMEVLSSHDAELVESMRDDYFPTIPGITTCTQFGLPATLLGILLYFHGKRRAIRWVAVVAVIAFLRTILLSERLAIIELVVPASILTIRLFVLSARNRAWLRKAGNVAPLVAPLFLAVTFGAFEYVRSWHYYVDQFDSYPQFVTWRLSGYYTTAHNNAAMALETDVPRPLPYYTLLPFWEFPGVENSPFGYEKLTGLDVIANHKQMLENYGNPEFNNEGGLFQPMLDWGLPGSMVFWLGYGFLAGRLYRYYLIGHLGGVLFYPVIFHSLLDVPRILLICNPRLTPALAILVLVVLTSQSSSDEPS